MPSGKNTSVSFKSLFARGLYPAALFLLLVVIFLPALSAHWRLSMDPYTFADDVVQQVVPFLKYHDAELFRDDYSADYFLSAVPSGFRVLYATLSRFLDPLIFTRGIHFFLLFLVLVGVSLSAYRLCGATGAFVAVAFCLSADIYLFKMAGGLPRAYAYPISSLGVAALVWGRIRLFAAMTLVAAAVYPLMAVVFGMSLALTLLVLPGKDRGEGAAWKLPKRILLLAAVAFMTALLALPPVVRLKPYGPAVTSADVREFPEAGTQGRFLRTDRPPFDGFFRAFGDAAPTAFLSSGEAFNEKLRDFVLSDNKDAAFAMRNVVYEVTTLLFLLGAYPLLRNSEGARRLLMLFVGVWASHLLSRAASPLLFIPDRYTAYTVPLLIAITLPATMGSLGWYLGKPGERRWVRPFLALALGGLFLFLLGGKGSPDAGLKVHIPEESRPLYEYVQTLPKDSLIAGMPRGEVNYLSYLSRRRVLVGFETHQAFHAAYALEMRRRMKAFIEAYYATNMKPIRSLKETFGVTHLLVDRKDFKRIPRYFQPYQKPIRRGFKRARREGSQLLRLLDMPGARTFGNVVLLDLSRLDDVSGLE